MLCLERREPAALPVTGELGRGGLRQGEAPFGMPPHRVLVAPLAEPIRRVLADGLEQAVAHSAAELLDGEQGGVVQRFDERERLVLVAREAHGGCGFERCAGREHGEASEESLLVLGKQVVAPGEGRGQRLLPSGEIVRAAAEHAQPLRQPLRKRPCRKRPHACGGELDRERQAVDPGADLANGVLVLVRQLEARLHRRRALLEELQRGIRPERLHGEDVLTRQVQDGAAGDEHGQARRARQQLDEDGSGRVEMLGVVDDEEQLPCPEPFRERRQRVPCGLGGDPERLGDRRDDQRGVVERRQLDDGGAVRKRRADPTRSLERQARLPAPSRSGQDEQANVAAEQDPAELLELAVATDEPVDGLGQSRATAAAAGGRVERGILAQDPLLELAKRPRRVETELVVKPPPDGRVVLERLGLTPASVERQHRLLLRPLSERAVVRETQDVTEHLRMEAERQLRVRSLVERIEP